MPLVRGVQGSAKEDWTKVWFLAKKLSWTKSPGLAVMKGGVYVRPFLPTSTRWVTGGVTLRGDFDEEERGAAETPRAAMREISAVVKYISLSVYEVLVCVYE